MLKTYWNSYESVDEGLPDKLMECKKAMDQQKNTSMGRHKLPIRIWTELQTDWSIVVEANESTGTEKLALRPKRPLYRLAKDRQTNWRNDRKYGKKLSAEFNADGRPYKPYRHKMNALS